MDDELKGLLQTLVVKVEEINVKVTHLGNRVDALETKVDAVEARLTARIDAVEAKIDDVRHVTSANHFKVVGRIEQVASMLADHMAAYDHLPPEEARRRVVIAPRTLKPHPSVPRKPVR